MAHAARMIVRLAMRTGRDDTCRGGIFPYSRKVPSPMSVSTDPTVSHREDLAWPDEPPDTTPVPVASTTAVDPASGFAIGRLRRADPGGEQGDCRHHRQEQENQLGRVHCREG